MDADIDNLQRVVATLESHAQTLLEMKQTLQARLNACEAELTEILHARHTLLGGIAAVKGNREEPEQVRH